MRADGAAADTELNSVILLFPPAPPDHLLSAPRGEHHPAPITHQGDDPKGLVRIIGKKVLFLRLRGFIHAKKVNRSFLPQGFQQHVGTRSDPGIHKGDVHNERV